MSKPTEKNLVQKTPGVCGENARIRDTRIPVWTLVSFRQQGAANEELLRNYPGLNQLNLEAA
jgi:type III restriction enzyme